MTLTERIDNKLTFLRFNMTACKEQFGEDSALASVFNEDLILFEDIKRILEGYLAATS